MGSRDLQPGDIIAAVNNMLPDGKKRRMFYLGLDFVRKGTQYPKLQLWQEQLLEEYPHLGDLTLESTGVLDLMPKGAISIRIHSIGGWGAITTGKNLAMTAFELAGVEIQANPKYGSEKKGQPTSFYATLAHGKIQTNGELQFVDVVLSPDPNVYRSTDPLAGMKEGGTLIIQSDMTPEDLWNSFPAGGQETIRRKNIKVLRCRRIQDRRRGVRQSRPPLPDAGCGLHGCLLQGLPFHGPGEPHRRNALRGDLRTR